MLQIKKKYHTFLFESFFFFYCQGIDHTPVGKRKDGEVVIQNSEASWRGEEYNRNRREEVLMMFGHTGLNSTLRVIGSTIQGSVTVVVSRKP